ncbi:DUF1343 domain-containing protein [Granulicella sp. dw_53]|uniref:DUF1343 domain-containing protein n=1 Tax=Granulicella sp. dw_53 TaxID=2719792 RepID=UPI001BD30FB9|nr:DUF1343 domain-containing protein [Granulicella sp. dw_53]
MKLLMLSLFASIIALPALAEVETGIDVLESDNFAPLREMVAKHGGHLRLGLMTDQAGLDIKQRRTVDVLQKDAVTAVPGLSLVALFSPEHGISGVLDRSGISDTKDEASGLPVTSLFGSDEASRHPTEKQLEGVDAVVIDLQDVGVRYYTFETVVGYFVEAAAAYHKEVIVLDRPNPIAGLDVQGPLTTAGRENYISYYAEPVRQGMTMGELATFFNGEKHLNASLTVIKMTGWHRKDWFDQTGLLWINPSPNLRSLTQAIVYPGIGLLEGSNLSVGRGTDTPFVRLGATWIHGVELAAYLNARKIPGLSFIPVFFTPGGEQKYPYHGERCEGVEILVNDRNIVDGPELGMEVASAIWKLYPSSFQIDRVDRLLLNKDVLAQIKNGTDPRKIASGWQAELDSFKKRRAKYLLYN